MTNKKKGIPSNDEKEKVKKLIEEVDKAEAQLMQSRLATAQMHVLWRTHLFRMSLLVLVISFHQCRAPSMECIKNIKSTMTDESNILHEKSMSSVLQTATLILKDSAPEIMGIFMVVCLAAFLSSKEHVKLTSFPYLVATMFLPLQLALFFQKPTIGCIEVIQTDDATAILRRKFPISVVFHAIATLCCMLMEHQMRVRNGDIRDIRNLRIKINEKVQEKRKTK